MQRFEYRLVKAPSVSVKFKNKSRSDGQFAQIVMDSMNELARDGWQFLRAETLNENRRLGLFGKKTLAHEFMVFRRPLHSSAAKSDDHVSPMRPKRPKRTTRNQSPDSLVPRLRVGNVINLERGSGGTAA